MSTLLLVCVGVNVLFSVLNSPCRLSLIGLFLAGFLASKSAHSSLLLGRSCGAEASFARPSDAARTEGRLLFFLSDFFELCVVLFPVTFC